VAGLSVGRFRKVSDPMAGEYNMDQRKSAKQKVGEWIHGSGGPFCQQPRYEIRSSVSFDSKSKLTI